MQQKNGKTITIEWKHTLTIKVGKSEETKREKSEKNTTTSAHVIVSNSSKG